jgi:phosphoribosylformylglycinamidine synthase
MTAGEILMSESQERMLAIVEPAAVADVVAVAEKWEVNVSVIGTVTEGGSLRVRQQGELVAELPAASLSDDAPKYDRLAARPDYLDELWAAGITAAPPGDVADVLPALLDDPALGDRSWIYQQYDHQLFLNTVIEPGHDGSLLRIKGTDKALAVSTDGNGRRCYLDPRRGASRLVMESALNVAVTGTMPYAVVDNLNFGNPEKPEIMWQFTETIDGMAEACEQLRIPVIGGNVSFYNETAGVDIYPSPVVGMLGFADPMPSSPPRLDRARAGMEIWLVGPREETDFAASAYSRVIHGRLDGRPAATNPGVGRAVIAAAAELAHHLPVLHDISTGGIAVALAEIAITSGIGLSIGTIGWSELWSEGPHRFLALCEPGSMTTLEVPTVRIGTMGGTSLDFGEHGSVALATAAGAWRAAIPRRMA